MMCGVSKYFTGHYEVKPDKIFLIQFVILDPAMLSTCKVHIT